MTPTRWLERPENPVFICHRRPEHVEDRTDTELCALTAADLRVNVQVGNSLTPSFRISVPTTAARNAEPPNCGGHIDRRIDRHVELNRPRSFWRGLLRT